MFMRYKNWAEQPVEPVGGFLAGGMDLKVEKKQLANYS